MSYHHLVLAVQASFGSSTDEVHTYPINSVKTEKFLGSLLFLTVKTCRSKYFEKQHEDLLKIYKWYKANKKLITSPPVC